MSSNKKNLLKTVFTANGSCGCGKSKAIEVHEPTPILKNSNFHQKTNPSSKASSTTTSREPNGALSMDDDDDDFTSTTISEPETITTHHDHNIKSPMNYSVPKQSPLINSVAIEKDSEDPYHDFRHSMLQMIFEKEIDSEDDLQDLLQCFLHLNATCHHHVILKAFKEICEEAFPDKVSTSATPVVAEPSPSHRNIIRKSH